MATPFRIVAPAKAAPTPLECSFDKDRCQWRPDAAAAAGQSEWRLATPTRRPANLVDHTFGASSTLSSLDK